MRTQEDDSVDPVRARFEREGLEQDRNGARVFCAFAAAMLIVSAMYSWAYEREIFSSLFHIRLSALAAMAAAYALLGTSHGARWPRQIAVASMLIMTLAILALAQLTGGPLSPQYDRVVLVLLAAAVMMTWSPMWALLAAAVVLTTHVVQSASFGWLGTAPFTGSLIRLLGASGVTVGASVVRDRRRWRELSRLHVLTEGRRHAEEEIRRLNEELEQRVLERTAELRASEERARAMFEAARTHQGHLAHVLRVTSMGGMVVELAHELNQPLGAIVNFANGTATRLRQSGADAEITDAVARIADEGMRAAEIIRRVREFVRPGGTVRQPVDLNSLVREATLLIESEARRDKIPLQLQLESGLPSVPADRIQVEQVILNLIRNAIEAMRGSAGHSHALLVLTRMPTPDDVELCVRDTGIGVTPDDAERIFEPFFTTKSGGLGMGRSISRTIVEAYGGRLWAEANPDRGMTFGFSLPTHAGSQNTGTAANPPTAPADAAPTAAAVSATASGAIEEER